VNWGILFIHLLFIQEQFRGQGYGGILLQEVEKRAKSNGCYLAHLDTFDFQGKEFYLKNGYTIFGILDDCPKGHQRLYFKKKLS
jgi:GNAT superfamily N-acetyltransferase